MEVVKEETLSDQMSILQLDSWKLPEEITYNIISRLPVKSVMQCRCVCKAWRTSLNHPHFLDMHFDRVSRAKDRSLLLCLEKGHDAYLIKKMFELEIDVKPVSCVKVPRNVREGCEVQISCVWASCNGLLGLFFPGIDSDDTIIYNPLTREKAKLPELNFSCDALNFGLGYHSASKQYKVLRVLNGYTENDASHAIVFTLGSNRWRSKGEVPFYIGAGRKFNVLLNEALHCLVEYPIDSRNMMVAAFDMGNEEFRYLPLPPELSPMDSCLWPIIQEFGEFLSFVDFTSSDCVEIWVMKCYGLGESWFKQYVIPIMEPVHCVNLIWPLEAGGVLLHYNQHFITYDPLSNQTVPLVVQVPPKIIHAYVHLESLVSPRM